MSNNKYPRIGRRSPIDRGLCSCCQSKAIYRIDIEVSYMRGDDEVLKVCVDHLRIADDGKYGQLFEDQRQTKEMRRMMQP